MSQKKRNAKVPKFEQTRNPDYKSLFFTGMFGGLRPNGAQIILFIDRMEPEMRSDQPGRQRIRAFNRELLAELHCSPTQFKSMALWMTRNVANYEKTFGEIPRGPQQPKDEENPLSQ